MSDTYRTPEATPGDRLVDVSLLGLPLRLMVSAREHHDGLMRELRLMSFEADAGQLDAPARLVELIDTLARDHVTMRSRRDEQIQAALARGETTLDLVEQVPVDVVDVVLHLERLLAECDRFCEQGRLMTLPRPPLLNRFVDWYLSQYRDQVQGREAVRWDGPTAAEVGTT